MANRSRSRAEWTRLIDEMMFTGATVSEFARAKGLNESTLSNWRCRLRREASSEVAEAASFVEVDLAAPVSSCARNKVVASLPNGVTLRFEYELSGPGLRMLVEAVGGARCGG